MPVHLVFDLLAYFVGFRVYLALRAREGDPFDQATRWKLFFAAALGALAGAKLLALLEHHSLIQESLGSAKGFLASGKTIVGGLLGGWLVVELTKSKLGIRTRTGDLYVLPLILGILVGRLGCFAQGLSDRTHGLPSSLPWAFDYGDGVPRHPTQLYEILFLALLGSLLVLLGPHRLAAGRRFRIFMACYLVFRLGVDFVKPGEPIGGMTAIQWACILGLLALSLGLPRDSARRSE